MPICNEKRVNQLALKQGCIPESVYKFVREEHYLATIISFLIDRKLSSRKEAYDRGLIKTDRDKFGGHDYIYTRVISKEQAEKRAINEKGSVGSRGVATIIFNPKSMKLSDIRANSAVDLMGRAPVHSDKDKLKIFNTLMLSKGFVPNNEQLFKNGSLTIDKIDKIVLKINSKIAASTLIKAVEYSSVQIDREWGYILGTTLALILDRLGKKDLYEVIVSGRNRTINQTLNLPLNLALRNEIRMIDKTAFQISMDYHKRHKTDLKWPQFTLEEINQGKSRLENDTELNKKIEKVVKELETFEEGKGKKALFKVIQGV